MGYVRLEDGTEKNILQRLKKTFCKGYTEGYIPLQQLQWLCEQLEDVRRNNLAIIFSHQILGDIHYPYGVSNATEVQRQNGVT